MLTVLSSPAGMMGFLSSRLLSEDTFHTKYAGCYQALAAQPVITIRKKRMLRKFDSVVWQDMQQYTIRQLLTFQGKTRVWDHTKKPGGWWKHDSYTDALGEEIDQALEFVNLRGTEQNYLLNGKGIHKMVIFSQYYTFFSKALTFLPLFFVLNRASLSTVAQVLFVFEPLSSVTVPFLLLCRTSCSISGCPLPIPSPPSPSLPALQPTRPRGGHSFCPSTWARSTPKARSDDSVGPRMCHGADRT